MKNLSGLMDRKIRLERKATGLQTNGQPAKGYESYFTGSAGLKDESIYKETECGKQMVATGRTTFTIRYRSDISAEHRLIDCTNPANEIVYNIEGSNEVGRREATTIQTRRVNQ